MINIKLSQNAAAPDLILRQTPKNNGIWKNCQFYIDNNRYNFDWWVVYDDLKEPETYNCNPKHTILVTGEPPSIKQYSNAYLSQFDTVITCQQIKHPGRIISQQGLPWIIGMYYIRNSKGTSIPGNYNNFKRTSPKKNKLLSIIVSKKRHTEGHRKRYDFAFNLKSYFKDKLDILGTAIEFLPEKWEGIAPYKYHIAIENCAVPHYFTEKLADSFLAESYPLYYGCPNVCDYFPKKSLTAIDIDKPDQAIKIIERIIKDKTFEKNYQAILSAKKNILDDYNVFELISNFVKQHQTFTLSTLPITIYPSDHFHWQQKLSQAIKKLPLMS